ncbi:MAG: sodium/proline symporter [bacterium]|nr:sodium/proline symporter [bacterium]
MRFLTVFLLIFIMFSNLFSSTQSYVQPSYVTWIFVVLYILISIGIGVFSTRFAKTPEQYFGSTKTFGPVTVSLASMAAIMSAFGFIGGPGLVYSLGFSSIWITCAAGVGISYGFWIIGKKMRAIAEIADVATLPDIARVRFQSKAVQGFLAIGLLFASIAFLSAQIHGGAILMQQMLGVSQGVGVFILCATVLIYMLFGGMSGHILTNAFQGLIMLVAVFVCIIGFFQITGDVNSLEYIMLNYQEGGALLGNKMVDGFGLQSLNQVIVWIFIFFVGVVTQPQLLTKMYTLKDPKSLKATGIVSGLAYGVASLMWILVGVGALYLVTKGTAAPLANKDYAAFLFLAHLSPWMQTFVLAGLLAAIMSTSDLFISIAASAFTRDFLGSIGHEIAHDRQVHYGRIVSVGVILITILIVKLSGKAGTAILGSFGFGFFMTVNFPVFVLGMLWKRVSKEAVVSGLIVGISLNLGFAILKFFGIYKLPYYDYMFALAAASITTIFVSFFRRKTKNFSLPEPIKAVLDL